ncbi:unnamed protein product [Pleuronectes platessa]|uniref:Uncharacterized protein n=1 Tax=Pleuronectes platessa TaxID=8262 RepID=A0A9N7VG80_PLEPL|nr:unnamed protein product [Pleuronectes platessa]
MELMHGPTPTSCVECRTLEEAAARMGRSYYQMAAALEKPRCATAVVIDDAGGPSHSRAVMECDTQSHQWQRLTCIYVKALPPLFIRRRVMRHKKHSTADPHVIHAVTGVSLARRLLPFFSGVCHPARLDKLRNQGAIHKGHQADSAKTHRAPRRSSEE